MLWFGRSQLLTFVPYLALCKGQVVSFTAFLYSFSPSFLCSYNTCFPVWGVCLRKTCGEPSTSLWEFLTPECKGIFSGDRKFPRSRNPRPLAEQGQHGGDVRGIARCLVLSLRLVSPPLGERTCLGPFRRG